MAIGGQTRESQPFERELFIGFFKGHLVAINPDRSQLNKLLEQDREEELQYRGEKDGDKYVDLDFWIEVSNLPNKFLKHNVRLWDKKRYNQDKTKVQVINCVGKTDWFPVDENGKLTIETIEELKKDPKKEEFFYFTKFLHYEMDGEKVSSWSKGVTKINERLGEKKWRIALKGEEELALFLQAWLDRIKYKEPGADILAETKALLAGNVRELRQLMGTTLDSFVNPKTKEIGAPAGFVGMSYVTVNSEDPDKQYQNVFKMFMPASFMKNINNGISQGKPYEKWADQYSEWKWKAFLKAVEGDPEDDYKYRLRGEYIYDVIQPYNPDMDVAAAKSARPDVKKDDYQDAEAAVSSDVKSFDDVEDDLPF